MKLLSPTLLLTVALVAAGAHANNALQNRDIFDDIKNGVQDAFGNLADAINIGHADTPAEDESTSSKGTTTAATTTTGLTQSQSARSSPSSSNSSRATSSSTTQKTTSSTQSLTTNSGDDDDDTATTSSSSSPSPTPTGEACKGSAKRCPTVGENTYQQCLNNVWTNQKCGNSLVCGLDVSGSVACMSKEQATTVYDKCTGNGKRCHPTESTKYQQCNGSFWATYTCDKSAKCSLDGNKNVICGSASGGGGGSSSVTYSLVEPEPYVPESAAQLSAKLAVGTVAIALVAAALGVQLLGF
ncbi:hypothetical protein GGI20_000043 [Coemansia sp. BCRC 34301]|nr:hypothetical protein GGI20_000043 [Coemansia sp. BCRC 34301]